MNIIEHTFKSKTKLAYRKKTLEIILHCSATPEGKDFTVEDIDRWHKERGFGCIGYQYVIYRDGSIHRGRPLESVGAHCVNHNSISVGICYIGGLMKDGKTAADTRTIEQKQAMYELCYELMGKYNLNIENIFPHYKFAAKECPSFKIQDFRHEYLQWVDKNK